MPILNDEPIKEPDLETLPEEEEKEEEESSDELETE